MKKGSAERWRVIPEFPNYAVSSRGQLRSVRTGNILRPRKRNGYQYITLRNRGTERSEAVHILVALAFIGPKPEGKEVAHWDDIKTNNRVENGSDQSPFAFGWQKVRGHRKRNSGARNPSQVCSPGYPCRH